MNSKMNKVRVLVSVFPFLFFLLSCGISPLGGPTPVALFSPTAPAAPLPAPDMHLVAMDYPRLDGSTSALPLQVLLACKILDVSCIWGPPLFWERRISPVVSSAPLESVEKVLDISHHGTHDAYVNLIENRTDFILVARVPSADELELALAADVELDVRPVALDAFVFLAHKDNSVETLTPDQVRGVYSGAITVWQAVGGQAGEITAYQRNPNSGSQELMDDLVMRGTPMIEAPDMILETMIGPINAIHDDPLGLGYSVFYYATFMLPDENIKLLGVGGVVPTSETITSSSYPLVTGVYAVLRVDSPSDSGAVLLRDWLFSEAGQAVVKESGYVPIR